MGVLVMQIRNLYGFVGASMNVQSSNCTYCVKLCLCMNNGKKFT